MIDLVRGDSCEGVRSATVNALLSKLVTDKSPVLPIVREGPRIRAPHMETVGVAKPMIHFEPEDVTARMMAITSAQP